MNQKPDSKADFHADSAELRSAKAALVARREALEAAQREKNRAAVAAAKVAHDKAKARVLRLRVAHLETRLDIGERSQHLLRQDLQQSTQELQKLTI